MAQPTLVRDEAATMGAAGEPCASPAGAERLQLRHGGIITIIGVILLLAGAFAVALAVEDTNRHMARIATTNLAGQQALRASSILSEMEAAERGFVLTGDSRLEQAFITAATGFEGVLRALGDVEVEADQAGVLRNVSRLAHDEIERGYRIVNFVREGRNEAAIERLRADAGVEATAPLKTALANFMSGNEGARALAQADYESAARRQYLAAMAAALAIVVFGLHQVVNTYRFMRQLSVSRARLRLANLGLEKQVDTRNAELEQMVMRFQVALRAAHVTVFSQSADRRFTWISRDLFGLPPDKVVGLREEDLLDAEVASRIVPVKSRVLSDGVAHDYDYSAMVEGRRRWYRARAEPLRDKSGRVDGIVGAVIDITAERAAQHSIAHTSRELASALKRFDIALRGADVFVFTQDPEGRMTFASHEFAGHPANQLVGMTDDEIFSPDITARLATIKTHVLETGQPEVEDLPMFRDPDGQDRWMKLRVEALRSAGNDIEGVIGCAVDVTSEKRSEQRLRALTAELDRTVQRFQIALRGADITVFTQDLYLRYTWVSADVRGVPASVFIGRTEEDLLPAELAPRMHAFKTLAISSGEPQQGEFMHPMPDGDRWFYIRVEAQRDETGAITGLLGAAVDVTESHLRDHHNRMLLRELTHRTKNLLAVVQAMARQTLTASSSAKDFEERFSGRIQGLSRSLDILVEENWAGASITDLVRSQLGPYRDMIGSRILLDGPELRFEPEAAQHLGLALHELATNSARFGALSAENGIVIVQWRIAEEGDARQFVFDWREQGGPPVTPPARTGFGHAVLERLVPRALGGNGELKAAPDGFTWHMQVNAAAVQSREAVATPIKVWGG